ncbi:conserved hypothetical protein [Azospirillaceae bacterium]
MNSQKWTHHTAVSQPRKMATSCWSAGKATLRFFLWSALWGGAISALTVFMTPLTQASSLSECPEAISQGAMALCEKAASGDSMAQLEFGVMLLSGRGVSRNEKKATIYLRQAADQGNPVAQVMLGDMLEHGRILPKNEQEAAYYYRLVADYPHIEKHEDDNRRYPSPNLVTEVACINLASMFETGRGVPYSLHRAKYYYEIAAGKGNRVAKEALLRIRPPEK